MINNDLCFVYKEWLLKLSYHDEVIACHIFKQFAGLEFKATHGIVGACAWSCGKFNKRLPWKSNTTIGNNETFNIWHFISSFAVFTLPCLMPTFFPFFAPFEHHYLFDDALKISTMGDCLVEDYVWRKYTLHKRGA